jgi:DnaJ like chaperone protein
MSIVSRIIAGARGLSLGGPLGALLERAARYLPSSLRPPVAEMGARRAQNSVAFTIAAIALAAKMAKADGTVSRDEVSAFRELFRVAPGEEAHLRRVFDLARRNVLGFDSYARQVGRLFSGQHAVLEDLLRRLFYIALADGRVCPAEDAYLREVARLFGLSPADYARIATDFTGPGSGDDENPYAALGIAPDASPAEIRAAHRRLVRAYHPDVHAAGGSRELLASATARVAQINAARDRLLGDRVAQALSG